MNTGTAVWTRPDLHLSSCAPDGAFLYFAPAVLAATARQFLSGFDGMVTYAVKANSLGMVVENLAAGGIAGFDVASPAEIDLVRRCAPAAVLHYHNPVRSTAEIVHALRAGPASWSVDAPGEFDKLAAALPPGAEIAVRLALPVAGAAYDFGEKFGAGPDLAAMLLGRVARAGFTPSMTFHPGTQCGDAAPWAEYIRVAAAVARRAGVKLARLNVGGGFAAHRGGPRPDLQKVFDGIRTARDSAFGADRPALVCEPGRAMVAEAFSLATRVKSRRPGAVYLNDGIYGALAEAAQIGPIQRLRCFSADGRAIRGPARPFTVFGPSCDSLDRLPGTLDLPVALAEGDYVLFDGMGAYSCAMATRFNGYGPRDVVTVQRLG